MAEICKFYIIKEGNFKFSGNAQLLYTEVHIEKDTWLCIIVDLGMPRRRQNVFVSLWTPHFGILFRPFGFLLGLWFPTNNKPCRPTSTRHNYGKVWHSCFGYILIMPSPLIGGGIKRWCCLTPTCLTFVAFTGTKSRKERPGRLELSHR